jgi:hypothetical protein
MGFLANNAQKENYYRIKAIYEEKDFYKKLNYANPCQ